MSNKNLKKNFLWFAGNLIVPFLIDLLCRTYRIKFKNPGAVNKLEESRQNYVAAFWHGNMIVPWYINRGKFFSALVSQSRDGEILSRILKKWKYDVTRGSTNIGGKEALEVMLNKANSGYSIAITPDGPTGPVHKMKAGPVIISKKTGIPLVLIGTASSKKKILNSWDNFEIPLPFSIVNINYSEPVYINAGQSYEETSAVILKMEEKLNHLQKESSSF